MIDYRTAKGWLTVAERELLVELGRWATVLRNSIGGCIINIGVEYGASVHCLQHGFKGEVVGIDIDTSKFEGNRALPLRLVQCSSAQVVGTTVFTHGKRGIMCETSRVLVEGIETTGEISEFGLPLVVFVDGDHSYTAVLSDARLADFIPVRGIIAFHDCYDLEKGKPHPHPWDPDCNKAVQAWHDAHRQQWQEQEPVDSIRWFRRVT